MGGSITTESLAMLLALIGVVIVASALLSGFIERSNFPQVAVFLLLGVLLGPTGLGMLDVGLDSGILRVVATLSLALVLFTDAMTLDLAEVKRHAGLAAIILIPGTLLSAALVGLAGWGLLGLAPAAAAIVAAPLASTDPVLLRGLLRRPDLPSAARQSLRLESGLNDVVLLPVILLAMNVLMAGEDKPTIGRLMLQMLVIGPGAGALVAWIGITALEFMRKHVGVRRDYESIYSLGIAFAAFAAAESLHGSGYLAAFAAGLTIAALDVELCDCFREYGETTAEMLLLFTFVLLGASLIWTGLDGLTLPVIAFAVLALVARPLSLWLALWRTKIDARSRGLIVWFGPRGLSTLLLVLVPAFEGVPGSQQAFQICALVVLISIVLHGGSVMVFGKPIRRKHPKIPLPMAGEGTPAEGSVEQTAPEQISATELKKRIDEGQEVWLLDVRSTASYLNSNQTFEGAIRIDPEQARRTATLAGVPKEAWAALFCT